MDGTPGGSMVWLVCVHVKDSFLFSFSHCCGDREIKKKRPIARRKNKKELKFFYKLWNASENTGERALTGSTLAALTASRERGQKREEETQRPAQQQQSLRYRRKKRDNRTPKDFEHTKHQTKSTGSFFISFSLLLMAYSSSIRRLRQTVSGQTVLHYAFI